MVFLASDYSSYLTGEVVSVSSQHRMTATTANDRRGELLAIAAQLFAERGLRETTVRDIADAAGILSGSLYHHFDSKESMVDEILRGFLDDLFAPLPRDRGASNWARARPGGHRRRLVRGDRRAARRGGDLPGRGAAAGRPAPLRLHPRTTDRVPPMWQDVLQRGRRRWQLPHRPRRRARVPVPARHGMGRRRLVPPRWRARIEASRASTCPSSWTASRRGAPNEQRNGEQRGRGIYRRRGPHAGRARRAHWRRCTRPTSARKSSPRCSTAIRAPIRTRSTT